MKEQGSMTPDPAAPAAETAADAPRDPLNSLIGETLGRRESDARFRAHVARGLDPATEHYAYPWVLGFVENPRAKTAYLRAAGLAAAYPAVKQADRVPLGVSLKRLSLHRSGGKALDPGSPDVIASRLTNFHEQDLEAAVATIRRFLDLARGTSVGFDFYAIARLLARWGNGFTEASQAVRSRTIGDYYGAWTNDHVMPATNQES
jgi:CRISPR type I-E-associated protein CasB/Cse2